MEIETSNYQKVKKKIKSMFNLNCFYFSVIVLCKYYLLQTDNLIGAFSVLVGIKNTFKNRQLTWLDCPP